MPLAALRTPIGWVEIMEDKGAISHLYWRAHAPARMVSSPLLREAQRQLEAYFARRLKQFDLPLAADGSDFARAVWAEMLAIPYGETRRYGDVAEKLGAPAQAVGQACGQNPIAIVIPCHRIIGQSGLGGYSSELGLRAKAYLIDLESGQGNLF